MYSNILAAVDGSERSKGVLDRALEVAERFDAKVHLFRSVTVPPEFPAAAHMPADALPVSLEHQTVQWLEDLAARHTRVRVLPPDLATTEPWRAITDAATRVGAELIVIGSHGYHGWDHLLRTNASKVADHADRDVLVVHARATGA